MLHSLQIAVLQNRAVQQMARKYSAPYKETGNVFDKLHRVLDHARLSFAVFLKETCQRGTLRCVPGRDERGGHRFPAGWQNPLTGLF